MIKDFEQTRSYLYASAITGLKTACCKNEILQAQELFLTVDTTFKCAGLFAIYCSALIDICGDNGKMAIIKLNLLARKTTFVSRLKAHGLPVIETLQSLIETLDFDDQGLHWNACEFMSAALCEGRISPPFITILLGEGNHRIFDLIAFLQLDLYKRYDIVAELYKALARYAHFKASLFEQLTKSAGGSASDESCSSVCKAPLGARDTEILHFGCFKLTEDSKAEPLEWLVLQKRGDKQLLLSKKAFAQLSFNEKSHSCDWHNSELRAWLNGEFANTSFSAEERSRLLNIPVDSLFEPTVGQLRTVDHDRVFLLNRAELEILLPHPAERICFQTEPTSQRRGFTSQAVKEACSWWLRPLPDAEPDSAELCMSDGNFCTLEEVKETIALGIRPAIWVKKG